MWRINGRICSAHWSALNRVCILSLAFWKNFGWKPILQNPKGRLTFAVDRGKLLPRLIYLCLMGNMVFVFKPGKDWTTKCMKKLVKGGGGIVMAVRYLLLQELLEATLTSPQFSCSFECFMHKYLNVIHILFVFVIRKATKWYNLKSWIRAVTKNTDVNKILILLFQPITFFSWWLLCTIFWQSLNQLHEIVWNGLPVLDRNEGNLICWTHGLPLLSYKKTVL